MSSEALARRLRTHAAYARDRYRRLRRHRSGVRERIALLEAEMQENRQLNRRIAELTDVVAELLIPVSDRDQEGTREALARYRTEL
jgi:predicted LPLAT superfamily acyltransferase